MTYIELLNRFWQTYKVERLGAIDVVFYLYLVNECNAGRWLNPFELQTRNLELMLQITRKTIVEVRNRLKQRGLIDFKEAKGRGRTTYLINDVEISDEQLAKNFVLPVVNTKSNTKSNTKGNTKGNTTQDSTLYIEDIRLKTKDKENSGACAPASLFEEEEKKVKKKKPSPKAEFIPPTLEEVLQYFLSQGADQILDDWETSAKIFYNYFETYGWVDKNNRPILRWDSRANSWILADQEKQKKSNSNGSIEPADRLKRRRGTDAPAKGSVDYTDSL